jgi:hypothetical protein
MQHILEAGGRPAMGLFQAFCGDTSMHGWQYLGRSAHRQFAPSCRGEKRPVWLLVIMFSIGMSGYFLFTNLTDYKDDYTVTSLDSMTELLSEVYFPSVTICSANQMRWGKCIQTDSLSTGPVCRNTFLQATGLLSPPPRSVANETFKSLITTNYFTGNATTSPNYEFAADFIELPSVQEQFCKFLLHTGQSSELVVAKHAFN